MDAERYALWRSLSRAPYHFPMGLAIWQESMYHDRDSDGRELFDRLHTHSTDNALIQYGLTAFGFGQDGEISGDIHYPVIRFLGFEDPAAGQALLDMAMDDLGRDHQIYAFFHYFGMSACGRHGKLHESDNHVHELLLDNGFVVEHENVYYSRVLQGSDPDPAEVSLRWKERNAGDCREFAAVANGVEIGWGQVHFLPQRDIAYLRWIYIDSPRQHQGLGTAVMEALFAALYTMGIRRFDTDTALDNTVAQHYYEKNGFRREGITRSYFTK